MKVDPSYKFVTHKKVKYKKGDRVKVSIGGTDYTFTGKLTSLMSTQMMVMDETGKGEYFFYRGLGIQHV